MSAPIDQKVRDDATKVLNASFALSAGAGSGKTAVLSSRLTELLASGVSPKRIAAITFTEKAAGELQRRVRDELERRFAASPTPVLEAALTSFHELTLSTIHSFCRELLVAEPLDSQWAPGTEIVATDRSGIGPALAEWRAHIRETDSRLAILLDALEIGDWHLHKAVGQMIARRDLELAVADRELDWDIAADSLRAYRDGLSAIAAKCTAPTTCTLLKNTAPFRANLDAWVAQGTDGVLAALLVADKKAAGISLRGGKKGDWPNDAHKDYKAEVEAFFRWQTLQLAPAHRTLVTSLREIVVEQVLTARRHHARADFDDLLFRAAELLAHDQVRARLAERYDALLVDEMQDTDPIQAEVAALLARKPDATGDWLKHAPKPGNLFAVGDPKQSIFRFRRADFTVWNDLEALVEKAGSSGRLETLRQNFRSVPGIVHWVNYTFADMPGYVDQEPWRGAAELDPIVVVDAVPDEGEQPRDVEVDSALRHLFDLMRSGAKVVDEETDELRPLRWGDVMVLLPRWANAQMIAERLLAAGVEAVVEGGGAFFQCDEVRLCVSALRALDEPGDSEAIVHVLRGLFGLTAEELTEHVRAEGSWRYTIREQPNTTAARALKVLRDLRMDVHETGSWIPRLDELLERTRATAVWSLMVDGPARLANLDKLRALMRELETATRSPTQVVTQLQELEYQSDEDELSRLDVDSDAVRVTTVFKAKGLEAPVVVLLDLDRMLQVGSVIVDRRANSMHLKIGKYFMPPDWDEAHAREKDELDAERRRWMYVAATRARDQLIVVRGPQKKSSLLPYIERGLDEGSHDQRIELATDVAVRVRKGRELDEVPYREETFPGLDPQVDALVQAPPGKGDPAGEARAEHIAAAVRSARNKCPRWRSVGEVVAKRRKNAVETDGGTGVGRAGGSVVHLAMEHLDLNAERATLLEQAPGLTRAFATEAGLPHELTEACVKVVAEILAHEVLDRVRKTDAHWKEVPFAMHERGRVISGVIDLAFPIDAERTKWVVVDWKSDSPPKGSVLRKKYEAQVATYAKALIQTVAPCEHVEPILVGPFKELPIDDAQDALDLVHGALREMLRRLMNDGVPAPAVGLDVGEPVIANLELAWEEWKFGLGLDLSETETQALAAAGWTIASVAKGDVAWVSTAAKQLREVFGIQEEAPDETGTADDVEGTVADE